jgi:hypothetical protein
VEEIITTTTSDGQLVDRAYDAAARNLTPKSACQGCGRSGIPAITRPMCSIPTATTWRSATRPGFTNNPCAAHAPSRRADTPDGCISPLGSCAASRFTVRLLFVYCPSEFSLCEIDRRQISSDGTIIAVSVLVTRPNPSLWRNDHDLHLVRIL